MWIRTDHSLPENREIVDCYRDSPSDAETMLFIRSDNGPGFLDVHEIWWPVATISAWRSCPKTM